MRPFAQQIANRGTLFAFFGTWLYLSAVAFGLAAVFLTWLTPYHWTVRSVFFLGCLALWHALIAGQRGRICAWALTRTLFNRKREATFLKDIEKETNHVFCATDLHAGEHVYLCGNFVYSYRFGFGTPADLLLGVVVQASAAFPGGFPPTILPTAPHQFAGGTEPSDAMVLSDGGVYDNMAEQWALGLAHRKVRLGPTGLLFNDVDELIVLNASGSMPWRTLGKLRIPVLGEIFALLEIVHTLYENTTSPRRTMLVEKFDQAERTGTGIRGCLVMIDQTPFTVADYYSRTAEWPERKERARAVLSSLGDTRDFWKRLVQDNRKTPTTLRKLGPDRSARLLYHGYVVAMTNLHVLLGYPLLPIPSFDDFQEYVAEEHAHET
jgi:hypothetical protein